MTQYDANKQYKWTPEDVFTLTGQEFGLILNTVRAYLASEEAARFHLMLKTNEAIDNVLSRAVESGAVKEVSEEKMSLVKD